jgi:myo-inositol-1(or 4)-monophosphatase
MDYTPMLNTAMRAARKAGTILRELSGKPEYQQWKGAREIVVGSVFPIQDKIIELIRADFPNDAILAEESDTPPDRESDPLWIVDPVDGSINFHQGIPHAAISIAYRAEGVYQIGVVYDPFRDEMFQALRGRSARLNDQPMVVQQVSEGEDAYFRAIVGADLPGDQATRLQALNMVTLMASQCTGLTLMGSPALGLCYVAAGRLHGYFALNLELWDVAAASVILSESGGILTDIRGGSWLHTTGGYMASNGVIHGWLMRNVQAVFWKERKE